MTSAADQLALAHERMTPEEIRKHALELARTAESLAGALERAYDALRNADAAYSATSGALRTTHAQVQHVQNLFAMRRKAEARKLLSGLAALQPPHRAPDNSADLELLVVPALDHLFNPGGSAK